MIIQQLEFVKWKTKSEHGEVIYLAGNQLYSMKKYQSIIEGRIGVMWKMIFGYVIILFYFLAIFTSCNDRVLNQRVEYSLDLAQGNRDALDSVLKHYEKSPQKLKAAKFLIAKYASLLLVCISSNRQY